MARSLTSPNPTRREFLRSAALATGAAAAGEAGVRTAGATTGSEGPSSRPNLLMICADEFRADFIASPAVSFLERDHDKPWLLFVSQLEPHQQNDIDAFVPPQLYADEFSWLLYHPQLSTEQQKALDAEVRPKSPVYASPYIPEDLSHLPCNWPSRIPGYYTACRRSSSAIQPLTSRSASPSAAGEFAPVTGLRLQFHRTPRKSGVRQSLPAPCTLLHLWWPSRVGRSCRPSRVPRHRRSTPQGVAAKDCGSRGAGHNDYLHSLPRIERSGEQGSPATTTRPTAC